MAPTHNLKYTAVYCTKSKANTLYSTNLRCNVLDFLVKVKGDWRNENQVQFEDVGRGVVRVRRHPLLRVDLRPLQLRMKPENRFNVEISIVKLIFL